MAIRVTDTNGEDYEYPDDGTASFETEQVSNNLCITTTERYVVFAEGRWVKAEQDNPEEVDDAPGTDTP